MTTPSLVELRDLVKAYETADGLFYALRGVDLDVSEGEFVAVIGKSGSGKSTLINAIAGIDRPTSGTINVAGTPVHGLSENEMAAWRGANLGVIFQFFQLLPTLTLAENVMLPMELARQGSARDRRDRALALLARVEMQDHADKYPSGISGGQQQRVAIARALANDPALIIADEPTGSLDSRTADTIFQLFEELVDQGKTILMVTHDNDLAERASRVVLIVDGEVVESTVRSAFAGMSNEDLDEISTRLESTIVPAGASVFTEGDVADRFYIVVRGQLEVARTQSDGAERVVASLGPGQYFGETALLTETTRGATVRAVGDTDVALLALEGSVFSRLIKANAITHEALARVMRQRLTADMIRSSMPADVETDLADLSDKVRHYSFGAGEIISRPGEVADRFCVVAGGTVEVLASESDDVAFRYRKGRHFGATGLSHNGRSIATLRAGTDPAGTTIAVISHELHGALVDQAGLSDAQIALVVGETEPR